MPPMPDEWRERLGSLGMDKSQIETLLEGDTVLTAAQVTFEFHTTDGGTHLVLTDQVTSFAGAEAIDGHRQGFSASLNNFATFLANRT